MIYPIWLFSVPDSIFVSHALRAFANVTELNFDFVVVMTWILNVYARCLRPSGHCTNSPIRQNRSGGG